MTEESGKSVLDATSRVPRVHLDIVDGGAGLILAERIQYQQDIEVKTSPICLHHVLDAALDLLADGFRPLMAGQVGQARQPLDDDPVLVRLILNEIIKFGVDGSLMGEELSEAGMVALKIRHPILMMTHLFLDLNELEPFTDVGTGKEHLRVIKNVEDIMQPGNGCQELAIGDEVLA